MFLGTRVPNHCRFVRQHVAYLSLEAVLLYFFLAAVEFTLSQHKAEFYRGIVM